MDNEPQSRLDAIREAAENIRSSNLFNDTFVSIALEDIPACQHVIRTILGRDDLKIISVKGQYRLLNLTSKDSILDIFAEDAAGRLLNIEVQRSDTVDHPRRTRYYASMLDKSVLDKGGEYTELPDVYIIYISETDIWKAGKVLYPLQQTLGGTDISYDDGRHVIYVNAAVNDGSKVANMMQYFKTADPYDMSQDELSKRIHFIKTEKGGYDTVCEAAAKLYDQGIAEGKAQAAEATFWANVQTIRNLKERLNLSDDEAMDMIPIPAEERYKYRSKI